MKTKIEPMGEETSYPFSRKPSPIENGACVFEPAKSGDLKRSCLDCSKIKKELDWHPRYNLEQGLDKTLDFFKKIKRKQIAKKLGN